MRIKFLCSLLCCAGILAILSLTALAKQQRPAVPYGNNQFDWFAEVPTKPGGNDVVGSHIELIGAGGIKINAMHDNGGAVSGTYEVFVDGSGIAPPAVTAVKVDADFQASANSSYFVSRSATCTLPSAIGLAGKEILVWNAAPSTLVRYNTTLDQKISGSASGALTNSSPYKLDRFMSDGSDWFRE
jgi:hypothetical protein